jgi:hypothetical protein
MPTKSGWYAKDAEIAAKGAEVKGARRIEEQRTEQRSAPIELPPGPRRSLAEMAAMLRKDADRRGIHTHSPIDKPRPEYKP